MKKILATAVLALFCTMAPAGAFAADDSSLMVGAAVTNGGDSDFGVGVRVEYPLDMLLPNLSVAGSFNYFFPPDYYDSWFELNVNALYAIEVNDMFMPYAGGGINYRKWKREWTETVNVNPRPFAPPQYEENSYSDSDSGFSVNVVGGCKFNFDIMVTPFAEVRLGIGDNTQLEITAGALYAF